MVPGTGTGITALLVMSVSRTTFAKCVTPVLVSIRPGSYIYMPLLEETGYIPTEKYAKAPNCRNMLRESDANLDCM